MRPPDEHQANPTEPPPRPNLMSSAHHGDNEDSILARLERDPAHRAGIDRGARLVWYGSAVVIALGLTATLAWLAARQGEVQPGQQAARVTLVDIAPAPLPGPVADPVVNLVADPVVDPTADATAPVMTAMIVDAQAAPAPAHRERAVTTPVPDASPLPPLRLLAPAGSRPPPAKTTPTPAPARAAAQRPPAKPERQAARAANSASAQRAGVAHDSDVTLISAVIQHAKGDDAAEPAEAPAACPGASCRRRPSR